MAVLGAVTSLGVYRQASAKLLGPFYTGIATSGSLTTVLECATSPYKSSLAQDDLYKDYWLMRPGAASPGDVTRIVDTYTASAGFFKPDGVWANAPYALGQGESFELHGHPVEPFNVMTEMINTTLKRTLLIREITFTPFVNNIRYNLTTSLVNWPLRPEWVTRAGYLIAGETRDTVDPFRTRPLQGIVSIDADQLYFNYNWPLFDGTETVYLECLKPSYYDCSANFSSALGTLAGGLAADTDLSAAAPEWVAAGVAVLAWDRYGHLLEQAANQKLIRDAQKAAAWFNYQTEVNFIPPVNRLQNIRAFGPSRYGSGTGGWSY